MAKTYKFTKRDKNRYRKIYRYIRKKPVYHYCSADDYKLIVGYVDFTNTAGPITYTYPSSGKYAVKYKNAPIVTAIAVDSKSNSSADVNIFITSITILEVKFSSSAPFTGRVHFQIFSQD
jgi:hypothetical protein